MEIGSRGGGHHLLGLLVGAVVLALGLPASFGQGYSETGDH